MELPVSRKATPKLRRLAQRDQTLAGSRREKRCLQVPTMIFLLILVNIWCTFLFVHSFHLCVSSSKIDLYCISMGTGSRSKLSSHAVDHVEVGSIIDNRLSDGRKQQLAHAVKAIQEQAHGEDPKQEPVVEIKVAEERISSDVELPQHQGRRKNEPVDEMKVVEEHGPDGGKQEAIDGMKSTEERVHISNEEGRQQDDGIKAARRNMHVLRSWASKGTHVLTTARQTCDGHGIFVYELPSKFNKDLSEQCNDLLPWTNLCQYFANDAMGEPVPQLGKGWYRSHQYFLEPIFHSRISNHPCRVYDHSAAKLFYVPFYGGLDVLRWHFKNVTTDVKDALCMELIRWLEDQPSWTRNAGADHMFVLGKISWDFRRTTNRDAWGSNFLLLDQMKRPYKFLIERNPWEINEVGVPHPTHFHPHDDAEITQWQLRLSSSQRKNLVGFAGAARDEASESIRSALIKQCTASVGECRFLDCAGGGCMSPEAVVGLFMESEFCLQPPGDSPTRKSVFDSLVSGCIPVLFSPFTAYYQYPWHLPEEQEKYSVFIDEEEVKQGKVDVMERLKKISVEEREEMRRYIVHQVMPGLVYGDSTARFEKFRDAFDIVVDNMIDKAITGPE